jgi:hypothetical protein
VKPSIARRQNASFCEFSHRMCHNLLNVCGKAEREVLNSGGVGVGKALLWKSW